MNWMLGPLREGIMTILIVAGPIILAAAAVGLLIGVLQAATQVQDQTIPSAVKLIGVMILLVIIGFWMFSYLTRFTEKSIGKAFSMVMQNRNPISDSEDIAEDETNTGFNSPEQFREQFPEQLRGQTQGMAPPFGNLGATPYSSGSSSGLSPRQMGLGQFSSNNGSFQPSVAPTMQAFSNAMQTQGNPTSEVPTYSSTSPAYNNNNYGANGQNNRTLSYGGNSPNYGSNYGYNQSMPSEAYSYPSSNSPTQVYPNPSNNFPQEYLNNNYSSINLPSGASGTSSGKQSSKSSPENKASGNNLPATNKVILKSTKEEKKNKVMASAPEPVKIFRPKLPGYNSSSSSSEGSSSLQNENNRGDSLPSPYSKAKPSSGSDVNWW